MYALQTVTSETKKKVFRWLSQNSPELNKCHLFKFKRLIPWWSCENWILSYQPQFWTQN